MITKTELLKLIENVPDDGMISVLVPCLEYFRPDSFMQLNPMVDVEKGTTCFFLNTVYSQPVSGFLYPAHYEEYCLLKEFTDDLTRNKYWREIPTKPEDRWVKLRFTDGEYTQVFTLTVSDLREKTILVNYKYGRAVRTHDEFFKLVASLDARTNVDLT